MLGREEYTVSNDVALGVQLGIRLLLRLQRLPDGKLSVRAETFDM